MTISICKSVALFPAILMMAVLISSAGCNPEDSRSILENDIRVACTLDLGLTEESGLRTDWNDARIGWIYKVSGDTLIIERAGICADECSFLEKLVLSDISDSCPSFVAAAYIERRAGSPAPSRIDTVTAKEGILKIQDWDYPNGVISGKLESDVDFTFFLDLGKKKEQ